MRHLNFENFVQLKCAYFYKLFTNDAICIFIYIEWPQNRTTGTPGREGGARKTYKKTSNDIIAGNGRES